MRKKKKDIDLITEETRLPDQEQQPLQEVEKEQIIQPEENSTPSLEDEFKEFEKATSEFKPEIKPVLNEQGEEIIAPELNPADSFKIKMFLGFASFLLTGFNTFLFNMAFKGGVEVSEMQLNEREQASLEKYLHTPEIIAFLSKIPSWVWAVAHVEFMFYQKYRFAVKMKEGIEKETEKETGNKKKK